MSLWRLRDTTSVPQIDINQMCLDLEVMHSWPAIHSMSLSSPLWTTAQGINVVRPDFKLRKFIAQPANFFED